MKKNITPKLIQPNPNNLSVLSMLLASTPKARLLEAPWKAFPNVMLANNYEKKPLCAQHATGWSSKSMTFRDTVESIPQCHASKQPPKVSQNSPIDTKRELCVPSMLVASA